MRAKAAGIAAFAAASSVACAADRNLISNPGFEEGTNHWRVEKMAVSGLDESIKHSGSASMRLTCPEGVNGVNFAQTVEPVKPETRYVMGGWSKATGGDCTYFTAWFYDKDGKLLTPKCGGGGRINTYHPWMESCFLFTTAPGTHRLVIQCGLKYEATAWFDDLYLREVPKDRIYNCVANSSFEIERTPGYPMAWNRRSYSKEKRYFEKGFWGSDTTVSYHGKQSLKVAAPVRTYSIYTQGRISVPHMFSVYMRANRTNLTCNLILGATNRTVTVGTAWQRYAVPISGAEDRRLMIVFEPVFPHEDVDLEKGPALWVDAVQLEKGEELHTYATSVCRDKTLRVLRKAPAKRAEISFKAGSDEMFPAKGLTVDGRPFIPYWSWGLTLEDTAKLREWGVNCTIMSERSEFTLDDVSRHGLKAWYVTANPRSIKGAGTAQPQKAKEQFLAELKETVKANKDHPALLGWFTCDEPKKGVTPELTATIRRAIKEVDPIHPVWLNYAAGVKAYGRKPLFLYTEGADILCSDPYPIPHHPVDFIATITDDFSKGRPAKPVFLVLQFWGGVAKCEDRPTPGEETAMIYLALIHGARGLCFYSRRPTSMPLWESMKKAGREVEFLTPILFSSEPSGLSTQLPDGYESGIHCVARKHGGKLYLITVNAEYRDIDATFALPISEGLIDVKVLFENRTVKADNGRFRDKFSPYERHVYEVRL